jgi:hypothetical protein
MEQAMVEAAAYVLGAGKTRHDGEATFVRLLKESDRPSSLMQALASARSRSDDARVFRVRPEDFDVVPGAPLAYWMSGSLRRLFVDLPRLEGAAAEVRQGLATGDDFRFIRTFWEVDPKRVGRTRDETKSGRPWVPFAKGGEYSPFWADIHLVAKYGNDGQDLRGFDGSVIRNPDYYFRPGLTWPRRTQAGFNPSILPRGCVFADKGPGIFATDSTNPGTLLAWLTSRPLVVLLDSVATFGSYEVGAVQRMPWVGPTVAPADLGSLDRSARLIARAIADRDRGDETTRRFVAPAILHGSGGLRDRALISYEQAETASLEVLVHVAEIEETLVQALRLGPETLAYLDEERGPLVTSFHTGPLEDEEAFGSAFTEGAPQRLGAVGAMGAGSYLVDPILEAFARATRRHPKVLAATRRRLNILPPGELELAARELLSYLFGVALGRWDVRMGRSPAGGSPLGDPFDALPVCSPGTLLGSDVMPVTEAPTGYPLELPPARLLLDERGHRWDVEEAVRRAATALVDDPDEMITDALAILRRRSLQEYLRRQFFKEHLARYSKSRRKAPVYWPLTVPSRNWGVWVYAPALSRETLFAIAGEAARREALASEMIRRLQAERDAGGAGRSARQVSEALASEEALAEELRRFRAEADRIAGLGWEPDLDDGIILCAAPLATLFPAWPDAAKEREQIRKAEYPWATVSRWKDAL